MKKILFQLLLFSFIGFCHLSISVHSVFAVPTGPINPKDYSKIMNCKINPTSGSADTIFSIYGYGSNLGQGKAKYYLYRTDTWEQIDMIPNEQMSLFQIINTQKSFSPGTFKVQIIGITNADEKIQEACETPEITVSDEKPTQDCSIGFNPEPPGGGYVLDTPVMMTVSGLTPNTNYYFKAYDGSANEVMKKDLNTKDIGYQSYDMKINFNPGKVVIRVYNKNDNAQLCETSFTVSDQKTGVMGGSQTNKVPIPCTQNTDGSYSCSTGFGFPISTNPQDFITAMFQIILSISGGIALLLVIFSGYRMVVSQGNPEKIQEARDRLTSAIVGLLFIIFSLVILQIIGVDILHIPQFK